MPADDLNLHPASDVGASGQKTTNSTGAALLAPRWWW